MEWTLADGISWDRISGYFSTFPLGGTFLVPPRPPINSEKNSESNSVMPEFFDTRKVDFHRVWKVYIGWRRVKKPDDSTYFGHSVYSTLPRPNLSFLLANLPKIIFRCWRQLSWLDWQKCWGARVAPVDVHVKILDWLLPAPFALPPSESLFQAKNQLLNC